MTYTNGLPLKPRIPSYFHIVPMSGDRIQLRSAHKTVILSGKSIKAVGRLLDSWMVHARYHKSFKSSLTFPRKKSCAL